MKNPIDGNNLAAAEPVVYEEPLLLDAEDLQNVAGGCDHDCTNGDCGPLPQ